MEQHIWIVTGPAGCGKTTVAQELAKELSLPYIEGDDVRIPVPSFIYLCHILRYSAILRQHVTYITSYQYHSASNKFKMSSGEPLTDADRWDWLTQLREAATDTLSSPSVSSDDPTPPSGVVVTCSALKSKYRDVIRVASSTPSPPEAHNTYHQQQAQVHGSVHVHFVYLRADEQTLLDRVAQRQGHYMKSDMVKSQLAMLEEPNATTEPDMLSIDCAAEPDVVQGHVNAAVREKLMEYRG